MKAPHGGNRRVANVGGSGGTGGSGGGYWWQKNNPFTGAGSRAPSVGSRPSGNKHTSGGSKFPGNQQAFPSSAANNIVGPMGICAPNFVCVHWQLCRNSQVIIDGTGIIDKSKRKPAGKVSIFNSLIHFVAFY